MSPSAWKDNHNLSATLEVATPVKLPLILPFSAIYKHISKKNIEVPRFLFKIFAN
jgi:hypothetical protein